MNATATRSTIHDPRFTILLCLLFVAFLPSCAAQQTQSAAAKHFMFWPAAPDAPHIQYLTTISSSQDVTQKQSGVEDVLYGKDESKGLPFYRPYGIRSFNGCLYVCDASTGNLSVLDFRNKIVRVIGTNGPVHLAKPIDVAIASDGTKYVADTGQAAVLVYDSTDKYVGKVTVQNLRPVSVAVNDNKLYVSDIANSRIRVFDRFNGKQLQEIGGPGGGEGKLGGAMGMCLDAEGNIFVNDVIGCRVQKFSPDGKFIYAIGGLGIHPGNFVRPKLMTVDSDGNLYIVDNAFQNVQIFNRDAKALMYFGGSGTHPGAMASPAGICVSNENLDLFAKFIHPAFDAQRLIFVTNNASPNKINVYALGQLKPGKTLTDIADSRVQGLFGFDQQSTPGGNTFNLQDNSATQPATPPATQPATKPN